MKKLRYTAFIAAVAAMAMLASAISDRAGSNLDAGAPGRMEDAIRQAAVACYSTEGRYPESIEYLEEHYGLRLDSRYMAHYRIFGSNIPPEIVVTIR